MFWLWCYHGLFLIDESNSRILIACYYILPLSVIRPQVQRQHKHQCYPYRCWHWAILEKIVKLPTVVLGHLEPVLLIWGVTFDIRPKSRLRRRPSEEQIYPGPNFDLLFEHVLAQLSCCARELHTSNLPFMHITVHVQYTYQPGLRIRRLKKRDDYL
jgi:hypothetical protein